MRQDTTDLFNQIAASGQYSMRDAITMPWRAPGGRSFIFRLAFWYGAILFLAYMIFGGPIFEYYGRFIQMATSGGDMDMSNYMSASAKMNFASLIITIISYALMPSAETAFHKNIFFGDDKGFMPLRFGRSEFMTFAAMVVVFVCVFIGYFIAAFILIFVVAILALIVGAMSGGSEIALAVFLPLIGVFCLVGIILALAYLAARLAPSVALTVRRDDFAFPESWRPTRPFWGKICLSYVCLYLILMMIMFACLGLMLAVIWPTVSGMESAQEITDWFATPRIKFSALLAYGLYMFGACLLVVHIWGIGSYTVAFLESRINTDEPRAE